MSKVKMQMSIEEIRDRINAKYESGAVTAVQFTQMMKALDKYEYRRNYNRRPEVKAKRYAYNKLQRVKEKAGRSMIADLIGSIESDEQ